MNILSNKRIARSGAGLALAVAIAIGTFLPVMRTSDMLTTQPVAQNDQAVLVSDEYIHVDYARKKLICEPKQNASTTARIEAWRMPAGGMKYWTNTASIPIYLDQGAVLSAIDVAAQTWLNAGAPSISSEGNADTAGSITDGKNTISFGIVPIDAVAAATMRVSNGVVVEADIVLDAASLWATNPTSAEGCSGVIGKFDVQNILTHEFGHWVGAKHPRDEEKGDKWRTMYSEVAPGELHKRSLTTGDKNSIPADSSSSEFSGTVTRGGDDDG